MPTKTKQKKQPEHPEFAGMPQPGELAIRGKDYALALEDIEDAKEKSKIPKLDLIKSFHKHNKEFVIATTVRGKYRFDLETLEKIVKKKA